MVYVPAINRRLRVGLLLIGLALVGPLQPAEVPVLAACTPAVVMSSGSVYLDAKNPSASGDGRYTAFESVQNGLLGVFVFDRHTCLVDRVSVNSADEPAAPGASSEGAISHDGRYVAFSSAGDNLGPAPDTLGFADVFVRDRQNGVTWPASPAFGGGPANGASQRVTISGDGRFVAFWSFASNLIASDTDGGQPDIFVHDMQSGSTTRVTVGPGGVESHGPEDTSFLFRPALSSDGRYIAFSSLKDDLVPGDTNNRRDVFRRDLQTGTTIRVSVATGGPQVNGHSERVAMSRDGRYIAFDSQANDVAGTDPDTRSDVFVHDVDTNTTTHVSVGNQGVKPPELINLFPHSSTPSISGDGRYVAFASSTGLEFPSGTCSYAHVRDLATGRVRMVTITAAGERIGHISCAGLTDPVLSDDGAFVAFGSSTSAVGEEGLVVSQWASLMSAPTLNLLWNRAFSNGLTWWTPFALPDPTDLVWNVSSEELQFHRKAGSAQAVVFQSTGARLLPFSPIRAMFSLGNTSQTRKRISVLIHDADFSDLSVCTFWLDPGTPPQDYSMLTHTTRQWLNATLSFYAATADGTASYVVDNVSLRYVPSLATDSGTDCIDPTAPVPLAIGANPNLLVNGDFTAGLAHWSTFGQIAGQIASGVFEFVRPPGTPAGVVFQGTLQTMRDDKMLEATFSLGNSSNVRKRVTVLVHDGDFSDLSACTFWLPPQLLPMTYRMRLFATKPWTNATVSVYPATIGFEPWIRLDNVTLREVGSATGTTCTEPDLHARLAPRSSSLAGVSAVSRPPDVARRRITVDGAPLPGSAGQSNAPRAALQFWLPPHEEALDLEITADGETWTMIARFERSDDWTFVELDAPTAVQVRMRPAR